MDLLSQSWHTLEKDEANDQHSMHFWETKPTAFFFLTKNFDYSF